MSNLLLIGIIIVIAIPFYFGIKRMVRSMTKTGACGCSGSDCHCHDKEKEV